MAIKSIEVSNIMIFQRKEKKDDKTRESFKLNFGDGINVLIGENGVGKTTLLKMIYAAAQCSCKYTTNNLSRLFSNSFRDDRMLSNHKDNQCYYMVSNEKYCFKEYISPYISFQNDKEWQELNIQSVFIPTTEMLSHSKGFLALNQKYHMPFDDTQVDIIVNASLPESKEISTVMKGIMEKISDVIDGTVILEEDSFYVMKNDGRKVDFSLEAEGLRKLGLLWKLIRNGLLEKDTVLLWDEPETNLNPELYPLVAEILLELQKNGVQIFAATHSYNFAKYLEIRREKKEQVIFHNLYKENSQLSTDEQEETSEKNSNICSRSAYRMEDLESNHIIIADSKLLDEVYNQ